MKTKRSILGEIVGWYGAVAVVLAYALLSAGYMSSNSLTYQALNVTGALGIVYIAFKDKDYQSGVLNAVWALIALFAIIGILIK